MLVAVTVYFVDVDDALDLPGAPELLAGLAPDELGGGVLDALPDGVEEGSGSPERGGSSVLR